MKRLSGGRELGRLKDEAELRGRKEVEDTEKGTKLRV